MSSTSLAGRGAGPPLLAMLVAGLTFQVPAAPPQLSLQLTQDYGWHRVLGTAESAQVYTVLGSTDLSNWVSVATLLDRPGNTNGSTSFSFLDPASSVLEQRFYRLESHEVTPTNDWKNQVYFPKDPFADTNVIPNNPLPIKFAIDLQEPFRVYYEQGARYPYHYDFVTARLGRFRGLSHAQMDAVSLHTNGQELVLGAVLFPPNTMSYQQTLGIQFVGLDPYAPERISEWFRLVHSTIVGLPPNAACFYMPVLEQTVAAQNAADYFAGQGIAVSSPDIWVRGNTQVYATGWALGRLKFFRALDIRTAFNQGLLSSQDILLTDGVPAEIPLVAGVITLVPTTPNSHVAILAGSYGIPFVYLADLAERTRVRGLEGHEILLRARVTGTVSSVKILDVENSLTPAFRAELLAVKFPPAVNYAPMAHLGSISASTTDLTPADIQYFGGKAANFGVLRRVLPANSPEAIAFSFDLWNEFMDQTLLGGQTLRATIQQSLAGFSYPPDVATLLPRLDSIRTLIRTTAQFSQAQQQAIMATLAPFDAHRKIRFRSSTNLEDTEKYLGAGLYDSYSGCLADDLDGDDLGPSACDETEPDERGVFRAIQRVYASFYNDDAFIERLRLGVDERQVGMGVLVHYSFPDTIELANGVATLSVSGSGIWDAVLNTQVGAESVTNPDGTSLPEIVQITHYSFGDYPTLTQYSTRSPAQSVLQWDSEYRQLMSMLEAVANGYAAQFTNKRNFQLDFEYKKVQPGILEIKQVREVPPALNTLLPAPFLINEPADFLVFQGEGGDAFDPHYQKARVRLETLNARLDLTNSSLLSNVRVEFMEGTNLVALAGGITNWPGFAHSVDSSGTVDTWTYGSGANQRTFSLRLNGARPGIVQANDAVRFLSDFSAGLGTTFTTGLPAVSPSGTLYWKTNTLGDLARADSDQSAGGVVSVSRPGGSAGVSFVGPDVSGSSIRTDTALRCVDGSVSGVTSEPVAVGNYYALTFHPGHHNFNNEFIIDLSLEPSLTAAQRADLISRNIKLLYAYSTSYGPGGVLYVMGFDNSVREVK